MSKWLRVLLVCFLAISLLLLGGLLPGWIAAWQDGAAIGAVSYAQIGAIRLQLRQELSVFEKLSLLVSWNAVNASEEDASLSQEALHDIVDQNLKPYQDAGLIPFDIQRAEFIAVPYIAYAVSPLQTFSIFWQVCIRTDDAPWQNLSMTVDDETGKILCMEYICENSSAEENEFSEDSLLQNANLLWTIYSDALGLDSFDPVSSYYDSDRSALCYDLYSSDYATLRIVVTFHPDFLSCEVCSLEESTNSF